MNFFFIFKTALRSLNMHKTRSLLTTLGIIVGIVSIIAVMSIGEGAKSKVSKEIDKLGTNFIIIFGSSPKRMAATRGGGLAFMTLKEKDFEAITEECDDVYLATPLIAQPTKVIYENSNWQTIIAGSNEHFLDIRNWELQKGSFFTNHDVASKRRVAVLGKTVAKELFEKVDPIGKTIRIKNLPFKVIGVLTEQGKSPDGRDQDDAVMCPITTVQRKLLGAKSSNFSIILLNTKSKERMQQASSEIKAILRQQHKLKSTDDDDFTIFTQDDISQATEAASRILNLLLIIIASISLIVGGIGIMNIMLVTVTERTREIGIRMAIGATSQNIQNQFILEAITICLLGGILGIMLGIITSMFVGFTLGWPILIPTKSVILSLVSSTMIGLFFGYYPAYKASQLDPVEALFEK